MPETPRPIPLGLSLLIAVFSALVALAVTGGHHMNMGSSTSHASSPAIDRIHAA